MNSKLLATVPLKPFLYAVVVFLGMTAITQYLSYQQYLLAKEDEEQTLLRELRLAENRFRDILNSNISAANTLAIIYKDFGIQQSFDSVAHDILAHNKYVESIQITENGIIKQVFPLAGNENTIGIDTHKDLMRSREEEKAVEKGSIYFPGPRKLHQGGVGILGKVPVMVDGKLQAVVVVLTRIPTIINALQIDSSSKSKFAYVLQKKDVFGSTVKYPLSATQPRPGSKTVSAYIPEGDWQFQVSYSVNFWGAQFPNVLSLISLIFSVIAGTLTYITLRAPYRLKKVIDSKTRLLAERIKELETIYQVNSILQKQEVLTEDIFSQIVKLLPAAWQYPEVCEAAIHFSGKSYHTEGYRFSEIKQVAHFRLSDNRTGNIEVIYTADMPAESEGPFLKEERDLINALAETITIYFNKAQQEQALIQSEARFRGAFAYAAIGMAVVSLDGKWIMVNKELCNMVGYTEQELLTMKLQDITHTDDLEKDSMLMRNTLNGGQDYFRVEKRYLHKKGPVVTINLNVALIRDNKGAPMHFVFQIENITERVESQLKFRNLVEKSIVGVYILQKGRVVYVNPRLIKELGYSGEELTSMPIVQLIHKDDLHIVSASISNRMEDVNDEVRYEARFINKQGSILWFEIFGTVTLYQGKPALIGTMINITDKKVFYDDLLASNSNIQSIFNNTNVNYLLVDLDFTVVAFNDQLARDYYRQTGILIETGKNYIDLLLPERKEPVRKLFNEVMTTSIPIEYEVAYPNGPDVDYLFNTITPILRDGKPAGICLSGLDITKRKLLELEHQKTIKALLERNNDLEQFSQIISHNLRGPLATILGLCSLLLEEGADEDRGIRLEDLYLSANKLDGVVHDLNDILQVRREHAERKAIVCLEKLVKDITMSISYMIRENHVSVHTNFSQVRELFTIKSFITSIFYNLITNSIKYAQPGRAPHIEIWTERNEEHVVLSFKDNGTGIDLAKSAKKLFLLYHRFNPTVEGKGLGLYMTKTQVDMLGGEIDVVSQPDVGTTFRIRLPLLNPN